MRFGKFNGRRSVWFKTTGNTNLLHKDQNKGYEGTKLFPAFSNIAHTLTYKIRTEVKKEKNSVWTSTKTITLLMTQILSFEALTPLQHQEH